MFESAGQLRKIRKQYNLKMFQSGVDVFRTFGALGSGALGDKHKELVALGISIIHACYGCIEYHVSRATELGASRQEILEATAAALAVGGGLSLWPARFVFKVQEELEPSAPAARSDEQS